MAATTPPPATGTGATGATAAGMLGSDVPSAIFEPDGPAVATDRHDQALVRAYELLESAQAGPEPDDLAERIETAEAAEWFDVVFVLHLSLIHI